MKKTLIVLVLVTLLAFILDGCGSGGAKKIREGTYDSMPDFESKFQRKSVMVNDSVEITYSSMEEAEWKYLRYFCDETDKCDAYNVFRKIVMSDSSSMCYPFDSIQYYANVRIVDSDDGRVRYYSWEFPALCYDLNYLVEYKWKDSILFENSEYVVAEEGECVHRMPTIQKINTFISDATTYYLVYHSYYEWGPPYEESVCSYVLDEKGLQPVTLFMDADGLKDHAFSEYYLPDWYYKTNGEGDEWLNYFDDSTLTVYLPNESNICDRYYAYKWNGRYFVFADSCASNPQLNMELVGYHALDMLLETERNKIRIDFMSDSTYRYAAWKADAKMSDTPELVIYNGYRTKGDEYYVFNNDGYEYKVGDGDVVVTKGGMVVGRWKVVCNL